MNKKYDSDEVAVVSDDEKDKRIERDIRRRQKKILNRRNRIKEVHPQTPNQEQLFHSFFNERHILLHGCAGTGKSFCALFLALCDLFAGKYERIIILRSVVPTRDIGFMPGSLTEKISMYEEPYMEIVDNLLGKPGSYNELKKDGHIEFKSTSFLRGITWTNSLIIGDELQNCTWHEICSLITRVGEGSRLLLLGDNDQNDLAQFKKSEKSGFSALIEVCNNMSYFDVVEFGTQDVLRSELVKEFLIVKKNLGL